MAMSVRGAWSSEPATAACYGGEVGDARCRLGGCTDRLPPLFSRKIKAFIQRMGDCFKQSVGLRIPSFCTAKRRLL